MVGIILDFVKLNRDSFRVENDNNVDENFFNKYRKISKESKVYNLTYGEILLWRGDSYICTYLYFFQKEKKKFSDIIKENKELQNFLEIGFKFTPEAKNIINYEEEIKENTACLIIIDGEKGINKIGKRTLLKSFL